MTVPLNTHDGVTTEVSRYPTAANVNQENHILTEVCAVGQAAQRNKYFPGQKGIHRTCEYKAITASTLN